MTNQIIPKVVVWKFPSGTARETQDFINAAEVGVATNPEELRKLASGGYLGYTNRENGDWLSFKEALDLLRNNNNQPNNDEEPWIGRP